jgi:hypothetical protein
MNHEDLEDRKDSKHLPSTTFSSIGPDETDLALEFINTVTHFHGLPAREFSPRGRIRDHFYETVYLVNNRLPIGDSD